MRFLSGFRGPAAGFRARTAWVLAATLAAIVVLGGIGVDHSANAGDMRKAAWSQVQKALDEGKPKSALIVLGGIEQAATIEKSWAEVARAIATRAVAEAGEQADDEPEHLIKLTAAIEKAPPETQAVLRAVLVNWTWG